MSAVEAAAGEVAPWTTTTQIGTDSDMPAPKDSAGQIDLVTTGTNPDTPAPKDSAGQAGPVTTGTNSDTPAPKDLASQAGPAQSGTQQHTAGKISGLSGPRTGKGVFKLAMDLSIFPTYVDGVTSEDELRRMIHAYFRPDKNSDGAFMRYLIDQTRKNMERTKLDAISLKRKADNALAQNHEEPSQKKTGYLLGSEKTNHSSTQHMAGRAQNKSLLSLDSKEVMHNRTQLTVAPGEDPNNDANFQDKHGKNKAAHDPLSSGNEHSSTENIVVPVSAGNNDNDADDDDSDNNDDVFFDLMEQVFPLPMIKTMRGKSIRYKTALIDAFSNGPLKYGGFPSLDAYNTALAQYSARPLALLAYPPGHTWITFKDNKALKRNLVKVVEYILGNLRNSVGAVTSSAFSTQCKSFPYLEGKPVYDCYLLTAKLAVYQTALEKVPAKALGKAFKNIKIVDKAQKASDMLGLDGPSTSTMETFTNLRVTIDQLLGINVQSHNRISRDSEMRVMQLI